jgi:hypothetical protein
VLDQVDQLSQSLPQSVRRLEQQVEEYEWGQRILAQMPKDDELTSVVVDWQDGFDEDALSDSVEMLSDRSRSSDSASESVEYGAPKLTDR